MKKIFLALALTAIGTTATHIQARAQQQTESAAAPDPKAPKFQFAGGDTHDFGTLKEGDPAEYTFEFKNTGKKPLVITNAQPSCGCTIPEWGTPGADGKMTQVVAPGKKGKIKVKYTTQGHVGPFDKIIWVESNAVPSPGQQRYELHIKGNVTAAAHAPSDGHGH